MAHRFVLLNTDDGLERKIESVLEKNPYVSDINPSVVEETAMADAFFENFNIVIKIEADSYEEIDKIIQSEIKPIQGIQNMKIYSKPNLH